MDLDTLSLSSFVLIGVLRSYFHDDSLFDDMSRSRPSRSERKKDRADVDYDVAVPFSSGVATIYLFELEDDEVEVIIANIPVPPEIVNLHPNAEETRAVSEWILKDTAKELEKWGYNTSCARSQTNNYFLRDIWFRCARSEVNEAFVAARMFIIKLEAKVRVQREHFDSRGTRGSPLRDIS